MRSRIACMLVAGLLVAADSGKDSDARKERERLAGTWQVVTMENDGARTAAADVKQLRVIFTGKKLTWDRGEKERYDATYRLDPAASPKTIDVTFLMGPREGKTHKGVYQLKGNELKICWSASGQERPRDFTAGRKSSRTLLVLKRNKP